MPSSVCKEANLSSKRPGKVFRGESHPLCRGVPFVQCCAPSYGTPHSNVYPLIWTEYLCYRPIGRPGSSGRLIYGYFPRRRRPRSTAAMRPISSAAPNSKNAIKRESANSAKLPQPWRRSDQAFLHGRYRNYSENEPSFTTPNVPLIVEK